MCMIEGTDGFEFRPLATAKVRTARKTHLCGECGRTIKAGEQYRYDTFIYEGQFSRERTCSHCRAAQEWLTKVCGGFLFQGVLDDLEGHIGESAADFRFLRLIVGIRRKWLRFDGAGLMKAVA